MTGCESFNLGAKLDAGVKKLFEPKRTPQQYMLVAVSSGDADMRRDAIAKVAESKLSRADWAISGMSTIATLESDPHTRCVAIRGLSATDDPRAADTFLRILNYERQPPQEVRPPDELTRWEATAGLADLSSRGVVSAEQFDAVRTTLLDRLKLDTERHARVAAARGLGFHPHEESVRGLIAALHDVDFAVVHECETALVRLTGHTADCVPEAWEQWCEQNENGLFANAGHIPESRRLPYDNKFEKKLYEARLLWEWFFPPKK